MTEPKIPESIEEKLEPTHYSFVETPEHISMATASEDDGERAKVVEFATQFVSTCARIEQKLEPTRDLVKKLTEYAQNTLKVSPYEFTLAVMLLGSNLLASTDDEEPSPMESLSVEMKTLIYTAVATEEELSVLHEAQKNKFSMPSLLKFDGEIEN